MLKQEKIHQKKTQEETKNDEKEKQNQRTNEKEKKSGKNTVIAFLLGLFLVISLALLGLVMFFFLQSQEMQGASADILSQYGILEKKYQELEEKNKTLEQEKQQEFGKINKQHTTTRNLLMQEQTKNSQLSQELENAQEKNKNLVKENLSLQQQNILLKDQCKILN